MQHLNPDLPIGLFDSGVGGLTVAHAITRHLPHERIIYFGDTAHMPYGEKSVEAIRHYSLRIADFLLALQCKCIIMACNTASAAAYDAVADAIGDKTLLLNVIDPVVEAVQNAQLQHVGVISTARTYKSEVYPEKLSRQCPNLKVTAKATPSLAQMIEEGLHHAPQVMAAITEHYLSDKQLTDIQGLVLACTHYPLIRADIERYYEANNKPCPEIFDSTDTLALALTQQLADYKLLRQSDEIPLHRFFVSDYTQAFEQTAAHFFQHPIKLQHYPIWE
jgi:glutamate racemase